MTKNRTSTRRGRQKVLRLGALLLLVAMLAMSVPAGASAQGAWAVTGIVRAGAGATTTGAGARVQLLEIRDRPAVVAETTAVGGRFRFEVRPDPAASYLVRVVVDGVSYLAPGPVSLSAQQPAVNVEVVVYGATQERPALRSIATAITIAGVDREAGETTLQREDVIVNPGNATWTGDPSGAVLQLPVPPDAISAEGQAWYLDMPSEGDFAPDEQGLQVRVPLRPGETLLITRFVVPYDVSQDEYELQLVAALPTDRMQIFTPARYSDNVVPVDDAVRGEPVDIEGERMLLVERLRAADAGDVLRARIVGLAQPTPPNPLTERTGAIAGLVVALAVTLVVTRYGQPPFTARGARRAPSS